MYVRLLNVPLCLLSGRFSLFRIKATVLGNVNGWISLSDNRFKFVGVFSQFEQVFLSMVISISRSSRPELFYKKVVLENSSKFTGNTFAGVSLLIKLQAGGC